MRLRFILPLLIALLWPTFALGAFTEFYCNASTGSNMNGGSDENTSPSYTATNGGWNSGTGVFTPTSGDPSASGVSVGQFAHVFADGGTTPTFIGRVTAVSSTTVTVSTTAKSGTAPGTSGTGISINVGGCWKGPNGTDDFPFDFITNTLINASSQCARVNLKNNAAYVISAAIVPNQNGPLFVAGYSSTPGDGGRATIEGPATGASFELMTPGASSDAMDWSDLIFQQNGNSGTSTGLNLASATAWRLFRVKVANVRGHGIVMPTASHIIETEVTGWNQSSTNGVDGIGTSGSPSCLLLRCHVHDEAGTNGDGITGGSGFVVAVDCIVDTLGRYPYHNGNGGRVAYLGCECKDGSLSMSLLTGGASASIHTVENCNLISNGSYGIETTTATRSTAMIANCGFGSGTAANTSGDILRTLTAMREIGTVTYASNVTPWNDPANGDFTITLAAAKGAGRGAFATGLTSTVGYPDIGAAQHQDSGGGGVSRARVVNPRD